MVLHSTPGGRLGVIGENRSDCRILVVAAHPDDDVLGCGAMLAKYITEYNACVRVLFMSSGVGSRQEGSDFEEAICRTKQCVEALSILGVQQYEHLDFPDNSMDAVPLLEIIRPIEKTISSFQPKIVITHYSGDLNIDHQLTSKAVMTACRPSPSSSVEEILMFEVLSSTEWAIGPEKYWPNFFVEISDYLDIKLKALACYRKEMKPPPHARSLENVTTQARHRGSMVGLKAAEAFVSVRRIERLK